MDKFSFEFGGKNFLIKYGVYVEKRNDLLFPQLRARKITIPGRSGSYDYGAKYYDDRVVELQCLSVSDLTRAQIREMAYDLSGKKRLSIFDEPDKHYMAQLYDPSVIQYVGMKGSRYTLSFSCEPFAFGEEITHTLSSGDNYIDYAGTAETPTRIILRNRSGSAAANIQIRALYKR